MLEFNPVAYGIVRHLQPDAVRVRGRFAQGTVYLHVPWQEGDMATEARAAREAERRLSARYNRPFPWQLLFWQAREMPYDQGIFVLKLPSDLPSFPYGTSPHVVRIWGGWYLNPTHFRFREANVTQIDMIPPEGRRSDALDLVGVEQPLAFPFSSSGLYYSLVTTWETGTIRWRNYVQLKMLIIGRELGNGFFTGREQRFTGEFLGTDTQNLSQLITTYLKEGKIQREIRQFITGDFGEGTRQGREFMDSAKRLLPQLGAVYARGLMLFGGE